MAAVTTSSNIRRRTDPGCRTDIAQWRAGAFTVRLMPVAMVRDRLSGFAVNVMENIFKGEIRRENWLAGFGMLDKKVRQRHHWLYAGI